MYFSNQNIDPYSQIDEPTSNINNNNSNNNFDQGQLDERKKDTQTH